MPAEKLKDKVKALVGNYTVEIGFYEAMLGKLHEEFEVISSGSSPDGALKLLAEKNALLSKISDIETINKPLKQDYNSAKISLNYSSIELDHVLVRLSFLLGELIRMQKKNEELLSANMENLRLKIHNVKKSTMVAARYSAGPEKSFYVEKMR